MYISDVSPYYISREWCQCFAVYRRENKRQRKCLLPHIIIGYTLKKCFLKTFFRISPRCFGTVSRSNPTDSHNHHNTITDCVLNLKSLPLIAL
jgi:hypothetical protein